MIKEISEEDFYQYSADLICQARPLLKLFFGTKTPTLLSASELSTKARQTYRNEIIKAIRQGRLCPQYCFAWMPTIDLLTSLFDNNKNIRENQKAQLQEVKSLVDQGLLDLRTSPNLLFPSGIVGDNLSLIHRKDPSGIITLAVEMSTGTKAQDRAEQFKALTKNMKCINDRVFSQLVRAVRIKVYTQLIMKKVKESYRQAGENINKTQDIENGIIKALDLVIPLSPINLKKFFYYRLRQEGKKFDAEFQADIISQAYNLCPGKEESVPTILGQAESVVHSVPAIPRQRYLCTSLSTKHPSGFMLKEGKKGYSSILLEAHIFASGEPLHVAEGFFLFASWLDQPLKDYWKRFLTMHRQLISAIKDLSKIEKVE